MQTMVPKSWRLCAIRPSACCAGLAFLPLRLVCATTVVIPTRFSTSYPSLLGRTHKPCLLREQENSRKGKRGNHFFLNSPKREGKFPFAVCRIPVIGGEYIPTFCFSRCFIREGFVYPSMVLIPIAFLKR